MYILKGCIMFMNFLCASAMLFAVDGWAMEKYLNNDIRNIASYHLTEKLLQLNEKQKKPVKKLTDVQKCKSELKYVVYVASILKQENSPQIKKAAKKLKDARIKEAEELKKAEKERLLQISREMINELKSKMSPVFREIYRKSLNAVLSSNQENKFVAHYENAQKKSKIRSDSIDITAIDNSLKELGINVTV